MATVNKEIQIFQYFEPEQIETWALMKHEDYYIAFESYLVESGRWIGTLCDDGKYRVFNSNRMLLKWGLTTI